MTRLFPRLLVLVVAALAAVALVAPSAHAGARPVTVFFGLAANPSPVDGGPALPAVPPQLGVAAPKADTGVLCRLAVTLQRGQADAVSVLDAARRQGCIRSYRLSSAPAVGRAGRVVTEINDLGGRWTMLENGAEQDYYRESGIEGFRASDGDRVIFSLAVAKTAVPACCL